MKRLSLFGMTALALFAGLPIVDSAPSATHAQDVTITIRQDDKVKAPPFNGKRPAVDVAILLDTSNSMDGLISQAKAQLWKIVQEFGAAEKAGQTPTLRVSVFEYGNSSLPASEGYVRQVCQLTDDLDKVSEALFGLTTNGGDEYCGTVINEALKRLDWSKVDNSYKSIFIAGNEPFTQGSVNYKEACRKAILDGVVVNTIHCGDYETGVKGKWQHGAELAEGKYLNINQDRVVVRIEAPQDKIIIKLNKEFNKTYLWYGAERSRKAWSSNQAIQDTNSYQAGSGGGRGMTKASGLYRNTGRDLVDSIEADGELLSKVGDSELPEAMQRMTVVERKAHIMEMATKRAKLKKQMVEVTKAREAFITKKRIEIAGEAAGSTLGDAVSTAVRDQLIKSGFDIKK